VDIEVVSFWGETVRTHRVNHGSLFKDAATTIARLRSGALVPEFMPLPTKDEAVGVDVADPVLAPPEQINILADEALEGNSRLQRAVASAEAALEAVSAHKRASGVLKPE
jgi:hypothetical protein